MAKQRLLSIIALLFVLSGVTGLIYQILWFKYLSLFLGNTTYAQTIVLAAFMGGLAIGAAFWGKKADRSSRPLFLYGTLEFAIGVYCLLYPFLISFAKDLFFESASALALQPDGVAVMTLKLFTSLLTLLPPTILMGGTLPVLVKTISESVEESGKSVAILYFLNSFGAVVGSILCGFFFIRIVGLRATMLGAGFLNILIAVTAFVLSRSVAGALAATTIRESQIEKSYSRTEVMVALAVAGISGTAAMIYEVTWVRMLIPVFGSSVSSFSLMLTAFISGITIGSWIVSKIIHRLRSLFLFLSTCQLSVAIGLCAVLPLYGRIPYIFWHLSSLVTKSETTYPIFLLIEYLFAFAIMIIPTIFLGMTLPIASRIATERLDKVGSSVGNIFSINTLGTVVGSLTAGFLLIPAFGVRHTIEIGIGLNIIAGLIVLFNDKRASLLHKSYRIALAAVVAALYLSFATDWNQLVMLSGVFRHVTERQAPPRSFRQFALGVAEKKDLYYKEGTTATVAVVEAFASGVKQKILIINGKGDASSFGDLSTQILAGQLPMLLHPHPESALVIGLGSGVTVGSILTHPVKSVECVEISPEVVEAANCFSDVNNNALKDARVHIRTEDALTYLRLANRTYDVIVSEPSNPWIAGIGNLYTQEFFRACKKSLSKGGLMAQWFHIYEIDDDILKLVMRTYCSVFPNVLLWQMQSNDVVFLGSDDPITLDRASLSKKFEAEGIKSDLGRILVADIPSLLSTQFLTDDQCREYADYGELNVEDKPRLEYEAPRAFFINKGVPEFLTYDERPKSHSGSLLINSYIDDYGLSDREKRNIGFLQSSSWWGNNLFAYEMLRQYVESWPKDPDATLRLAEVTERLGRIEESLSYWQSLSKLEPQNPAVLGKYAWLKFAYERPTAGTLAPYDPAETASMLQRCITMTADSVDRYHAILGDVYIECQRYAEAAQQYLRAVELRKTHYGDPSVAQWALFAKLAKALYYSGRYSQALEYSTQSMLANPDNADAEELTYKIVMKQAKILGGKK